MPGTFISDRQNRSGPANDADASQNDHGDDLQFPAGRNVQSHASQSARQKDCCKSAHQTSDRKYDHTVVCDIYAGVSTGVRICSNRIDTPAVDRTVQNECEEDRNDRKEHELNRYDPSNVVLAKP